MNNTHYDVIAIGSGFACSFFLLTFLQKNPKAKILIIERGTKLHTEREIKGNSSGMHTTNNTNKEWFYSTYLGGGSNCWWACTPRFMPNDFQMYSKYGVAADWPITYNDIEPYYSQAEEIMSVSGPEYGDLYLRSKPFPQPPHRLSSIDEVIRKHYPDSFFPQPTARARQATTSRPACCSSGICHRCPINAKFMIANDMSSIFTHPNVTIQTQCIAEEITHSTNVASGVVYLDPNQKKTKATGDLIILGANAIFNPFLLLKSGIDHPLLGRGINDQVSHYAYAELDGLEGFDGSTSVTGHGFMLYDGEHRKNRAACLMETSNVLTKLRFEPGRYRQRLNLKFIFEDIPNYDNRVIIDPKNEKIPRIIFHGHSQYTQHGIEKVLENLPELLSFLPIESIHHIGDKNRSEAHIQSTTPMGNDPKTSIVDTGLIHHSIRNLAIVGSSVFTTAPPPNPSLTIAALSLKAANEL